MNYDEEKIIDDFKNSIFDSSIDVGSDLIEIGIDSFDNNKVIESIPILKTFYAIYKIGKSFNDINRIRQTQAFINEFNSGTIDIQKLEEYKKSLNDPKKALEEIERVLLILERNIDSIKSKYLARLYKSRINGIIDWDEFCELSDILSRMFVNDFELLAKVKHMSIDIQKDNNNFRIERLSALGLISPKYKKPTYGDLSDGHINTERVISKLGVKFCQCIEL